MFAISFVYDEFKGCAHTKKWIFPLSLRLDSEIWLSLQFFCIILSDSCQHRTAARYSWIQRPLSLVGAHREWVKITMASFFVFWWKIIEKFLVDDHPQSLHRLPSPVFILHKNSPRSLEPPIPPKSERCLFRDGWKYSILIFFRKD